MKLKHGKSSSLTYLLPNMRSASGAPLGWWYFCRRSLFKFITDGLCCAANISTKIKNLNQQ